MKRKDISTFRQAEAYIYDIPRFTTKNTIEDTRAFLHRLGDPDRELRFLHVAGTNGKGSVCAYMRSILENAGQRVAVFTSPHLVDIRERFVIDGEMITEEDFLQAFLSVYNRLDWEALEKYEENAVDSKEVYHPSYFEFLFFMAMVIFAKKAPDFCILETGLGGRLDATNAVSKKEIAVITHLSLEHTEYLGDTIEQIAGEKAGILKAGAPVVYWSTCDETDAVITRKASELGISVVSVSKEDYKFSSFGNKSIDFSLHTRYYNDISLTLHTIANYQMENASVAVRALEVMTEGKLLTADQIAEGVEKCFWAGRMEEVLPEVFVDGAHNEDGIRAFLETVKTDGHEGTRTLLFSVVKDKDYVRMISNLVGTGLFCKVAVTKLHTERGVDTQTLQELFASYPECNCVVYDNVEVAFKELLGARMQDERIYIAGSLYLAGEIKELLRND